MSIKNPEAKVALISDIHIGVHKSSEKYLKWDLEYVDFLIEKMKERDVSTLFVLGDVFHNRREVSLAAIQTAEKFFRKLVDAGVSTTIIAGNHDCWNDNDSEITSVSMFSGWGGIKVVTRPEWESLANRRYVLVPWGYSPRELAEHHGRCDVAFGHFEINSFKMTGNQMCENGTSCADIEALAPRCFSGHFHLREHRVRKDGFISYIGSAIPLDWGDYGGDPKAICFYDFSTCDVEFVENDVSPRHVKVSIEELLSHPESAKELMKSASGNIVKIVTDGSAKISPSSITKVVEKLNEYCPADIQCDIKTAQDDAVEVDTDGVSSLNVSEALIQYVNGMDTPLKDEVMAIVKRVYSMVQ